MNEPRPPPYQHTDPEHPGSGCWGCTPLSHEVDWLRSRLDAAMEVLRECEFGGADDFDDQYCVICEKGIDQGHAPDCRLAAVLKEGL